MKIRKVITLGNRLEQSKVVDEAVTEAPEDDARSKAMNVISLASELGFSVALPIVGGALLGQYLDARFVSAPKFVLSLIFLGVFLAGANMYFIIRDTEEK